MIKKILILIFRYIVCIFYYFNVLYAAIDVQDYYDKAVEYEVLERYEEATEMYHKILEKEPENITILFDLANLYFKLGKIDDAVHNYRKILRINESNASVLSRLGLIYIQKGDYNTAAKYLQQATAKKPDLAEAQVNYSKLYYTQGIYDKALIFGKKAILLDPNLQEAYLITGQAHVKNKEFREAIKYFIRVLIIDHNSNVSDIAMRELENALSKIKESNVKIKEAAELYNNKNYDESRKLYNSILENDPYNPEVYYGLATIVSFVDQNNDEAIEFLKKAISYNPNYIYAYSGLALIYLTKEDIENLRYVTNKIKIVNINQKMFLEEAQNLKGFAEKIPDKKIDIKILLEAYDFIEYEKAYSDLKKIYDKLNRQEQASKYYIDGNKFFEEKQYNNALNEFKIALQLYPNSKKIKEKWVTALRELRNTINKSENNPIGHYILGNTLRLEEKFEEAEREYSIALDSDPNFADAPGAHYWLGIIYDKQGRVELAKQKFELVINKYADYLKQNYFILDAYWKLGNIYNRMEKYDESLQILEKAIERDSRWYYLYIDLATVYINKKQFPHAIEQIKFVLKKSPGHGMAENKLKDIFEKMGYDSLEIQKQFNKLYEQIIVELENEKRGNPSSKSYSLLLGKAYLIIHQYGKAINEFNLYLDKFPGDKKVEEQLLSVYRKLNYTPSEISQLELKIKSALLAEEYYNKGNENYNKNQFSEALTYFKNALKTKEKYIDAIIRIGDCYANLKKFNESVKEYKDALELDPNLFEVYSSLSYIYNIQRFYDRAIEEAEKSIKINPYFPNAYNNLGYAYMKKEEYDKAIIEFEKAIELLPDYSAAIRNLEKTKNLLAREKTENSKNE